MKSLKILLCAVAMFAVKASSSCLLISDKETVKEVLSQHMGGFEVSDKNWEEAKRSGSTNPVTDVFYNIPVTNTKLSSTGIELKQSGRYYIANNLRKALNANATYVNITGKNVVVDMNGCTIQGELQASSTTAKGIAIGANVNNIRVINGGVTGMQGYGVDAGTGIDTLSLEGLKVSKFKTYGIQLQGNATSNVYMKDVNVSTTSSAAGDTYGLYVAYASADTTNGTFENCSFNNITSASGSNAAGVMLEGVSDFTFKNCDASGNSGAATTDKAFGFAMGTQACSSLRFVGCTANNNSSTTGQAVGFYTNIGLTDSLFKDCESNSNSTGAYASAAVGAAGFAIETVAGTNNKFVNCTASGNTSATATASSILAGFALAVTGCDNCRFDGCVAAANSISGATNASICAGFYSTANDNLRFDDCKALGNNSASAAALVYGFDITGGGTSNVVNNCESSGNYMNVSGTAAGTVAGIHFGDNESLSTISNSTVVGNADVSADGNTGTSSVYGILLGASTTGVSKCSVIKNTVRSTAITLDTNVGHSLAGLRDFTTDSTSLIAGNVLALNGVARLDIGSAPDYNIAASDLTADNDSGGLNLYLTYNSGQNPADIVVETDVSNMQALSTGLEGWTNYLIVPQQA